MKFSEIVRVAGGLLTGDTSAEIKAAALLKKTQGGVNSTLDKAGSSISKVIGAGAFGALAGGAKKTENSELEQTGAAVLQAVPASYKMLALAALAALAFFFFRGK